MKKKLPLAVSHLIFAIAGFAAGIYTLPVLTASKAPSEQSISARMAQAKYKAEFRKDLKGSDFFHWGEGHIAIGSGHISFEGKLAPGPDYKLYLSPEFVETEKDFKKLKSQMVKVGNVNSFNGFILDVPKRIDIENYTSVIIWCETFEEFITAAEYR